MINFQENSKLLSKVAVPFYIPTRNFSTSWTMLDIINFCDWSHPNWRDVVSFCDFNWNLHTNYVQYLVLNNYLNIISSERAIQIFGQLQIGLSILWVLICKSFLYVLNMSFIRNIVCKYCLQSVDFYFTICILIIFWKKKSYDAQFIVFFYGLCFWYCHTKEIFTKIFLCFLLESSSF